MCKLQKNSKKNKKTIIEAKYYQNSTHSTVGQKGSL